MSNYYWTDELYHHGMQGQKWGLRRYQNRDGTLTPLGKQMRANREQYSSKNYDVGEARINRRLNKLEHLGKDRRDLQDLASTSKIRRSNAMNRDLEKRVSMDVLQDPKKLEAFGKYTRRNRKIYAGAGASGVMAGLIISAGGLPAAGIPIATVSAGAAAINEWMSRS